MRSASNNWREPIPRWSILSSGIIVTRLFNLPFCISALAVSALSTIILPILNAKANCFYNKKYKNKKKLYLFTRPPAATSKATANFAFFSLNNFATTPLTEFRLKFGNGSEYLNWRWL